MFDFLFSKRVTVPVTIIVLSATLISGIIQIFLIDTPQKRRNKAVNNSDFVRYDDFVYDTICDVDKIFFQTYLFCGYKNGCYFGRSASEVEDEIRNFIEYGRTIVKKALKSSTAYFINDDSILTVKYKIYPANRGVLYDGEIVR